MGVKATLIVKALLVLNPGSTFCSFQKLRIISPAPISRTNDSATSEITSALRVRCFMGLPPVRPAPCFRVSLRLVLVNCNAGTIPIMMPATNDTRRVKPRARVSIPISLETGRPPSRTSILLPHTASARPSSPPVTARRTLSVSSCRTSRARPAPSAIRTAISF